MKATAVPISWVIAEGHRFDCGPFTRGGIEARRTLESARVSKNRLVELTLNGLAGIYHVGMDKLRWVGSADYGVPLLRSADILRANLSDQPLISRAQVRDNPLFTCPEGTTLITRSGTIGRMAYCRADMAQMAISQDVLKVVPDTTRIPSGYLYAFLSSRYGVPLIVSGTFGSIIVHIEAENIANLPVPRLGSIVEAKAHEFIDEAAKLRGDATAVQRDAIARVEDLLGWAGTPSTSISLAASSGLQRRLDAFHHTPRVVAARKALASRSAIRLGNNVESVFEPNRGPRLKVDDPAFGVPFLSSSEVFRLDPIGEYSISRRRTPHLDKLLVSERDLLLPRSGQLGGIIGRAVLPLPTYYGHAASEHLVRVRCKSKEDAFFLWCVFASEPGYLATIGTAFGSSIPSLDCELIADMRVPWFDDAKREELATLVAGAVEANARAIQAERKAVRLVEDAIETGTTD